MDTKTAVYKSLNALFVKANEKFNAGLFAEDSLLEHLNISDKTLSSIINALYYPECPYEFSVLPVEILGSIYERFLGKVIRFRLMNRLLAFVFKLCYTQFYLVPLYIHRRLSLKVDC